MQNAKEKFQTWLAEGHAKKLSPSVCIACMEVTSAWAIRKKYSKISFWEISDVKEFNAIRNKLNMDKIFKFSDGQKYKAFEKVGILYAAFLKERVNSAEKTNSAHGEEVSSKATKINEIITKSTENDIAEIKKQRTIADAVVEVLSKKQPMFVRDIYSEIENRGLYEFKSQDPIRMVYSCIRERCDGVDMPNKGIRKKRFKIVIDDDNNHQYALIDYIDEQADASNNREVIRVLKWDAKIKDAFRTWLVGQGKSNGTAKSYCSSMSWLVGVFAAEWEKATEKKTSILAIAAFSQSIADANTYISANRTAHNQYSASLNAFTEFILKINEANRDMHIFDHDIITVNDEGNLPDNIRETIIKNFPNGFKFDSTTIRLLSDKVNVEIDNEIKEQMKRSMFRRKDDLFFLPESVMDKTLQNEITEKAEFFLSEYKGFEMSVLYSNFEKRFNQRHISGINDFEALYEFINPNVRCVGTYGTRIARYRKINLNEVFSVVTRIILSIISKEGGVVREDDLINHIGAFTNILLSNIIKDWLEDIIRTEINGIVCYMTLDALGLPDDFSETLASVMDCIDELGLVPTDEVIHTLLSSQMRMNFKAEFNILDENVYRCLIATYYKDAPKRKWKGGAFVEVAE